MSAKSDRQAAREAVAAYHETQLAALVERVGSAIDHFRGGQLNAWAAKELWKFYNLGDTELAANVVRQRPAVDWWERGAPRKR